jgi:hypothetical protein
MPDDVTNVPTLTLTDTRMAACLSALDYPFFNTEATLDPDQTDPRKKVLFTFMMGDESPTLPQLGSAREMVSRYHSGELAAKSPLHMLCVMMAAMRNYDRLLEWQRDGTRMRLVSHANEHLTQYQRGQEKASVVNILKTREDTDLCLVAAVGLVGLPVTKITGSSGAHLYHVATSCYPVRLADGRLHLFKADELMTRDPTPQDPYRLRLEVTNQLHPVCVGYNALHHRREIKAELERVKPLILMHKGGRAIEDNMGVAHVAAQQALFHPDAAGHVMRRVEIHMKAPPINWDNKS